MMFKKFRIWGWLTGLALLTFVLVACAFGWRTVIASELVFGSAGAIRSVTLNSPSTE